MKMIAFFPSPAALMATLLLLSGNDIVCNAKEENEDSNPSTRLSLAASNPFRMIFRPTPFELDFVALSIVEDAMADAILLSTGSSLVDVNINVNQMDWLGENNDELIDGTVNALGVDGIPTTVIKFFAVGTFLLKVPAGATTDPGSLAAVKALDAIIENAFSLENSETFVNLLRNTGDPLLEGVQDAIAIRTNTNPTVPEAPSTFGDDKDSEEGGLTTLDIVLISVSVSIFLGIAYMICQHHKDRGFIESQRQQALNTHNRNNDTSSTYSPRNTGEESSHHEKAASVAGSIKSSESSRTSVINNTRQSHEEQPSNVSSLYTTNTEDPHSFVTNFNLPPSNVDINTHLNSRRGRYTSKVRITIDTVENCDSRSLPTPSSKNLGPLLTSASSVQSSDEKSECKSTGALSFTGLSTSLSSEFGPVNWFRSKGLSIMNSNDASSNIVEAVDEEEEEEEEEEEGVAVVSKNSSTSSSSSSSAESHDVFQVGNVKTNVLAAGSVANGSDTVSKAGSSVMTEWMRTIRVIASEADISRSGSEITCKEGSSSSEQSSTAANSTTETPELAEEDDIESLEQSLADSKSFSMMSGFGEGSSISVMEF